MAKKVKKKVKAIRPKQTKKKAKIKETAPKTKRSVIVHKTEKPVENLFNLLGQIHTNIEELSRVYAELPSSRHRGVGGKMKQTVKQEFLTEQINLARERADKIVSILENVY